MSRFVEIRFHEGSAVTTKVINVDNISDFNFDKRKLVTCYGLTPKTYILTAESAEKLRHQLFIGNLSDPYQQIMQMQRDLDAYKTFFVNVLGWANGRFREGTALPAIGLFGDNTPDINNQMELMTSALRQLNEEYVEMKNKLIEAGITPLDSHAVDPDKQ